MAENVNRFCLAVSLHFRHSLERLSLKYQTWKPCYWFRLEISLQQNSQKSRRNRMQLQKIQHFCDGFVWWTMQCIILYVPYSIIWGESKNPLILQVWCTAVHVIISVLVFTFFFLFCFIFQFNGRMWCQEIDREKR